jgi:hypothetical protein
MGHESNGFHFLNFIILLKTTDQKEHMWRMCFKKQMDFHCYEVTSVGKIQNTT